MVRSLACVLLAMGLMMTGCPTFTGALQDALNNQNSNSNSNANSNTNSNDNAAPTNEDFDGNWQITLLGERPGTACIVIDAGAIVSWNDGCANAFQQIASSQPVSAAGDVAVWTLQTTDATGGTMITLNTTVQDDGNLLGSLVIVDARGDRFQSDVIMVRR